MTRQQFLALLDGITTWKREGSRAPHKPLLILLALGRLSRGEPERFAPYDWYHDALLRLLSDYGPWRKVHHPEMPFWRLQRDGLWDIPEAVGLRRSGKERGGGVSPRSLRESGARGGFPQPVFDLLASDAQLVEIAATRLLAGHFPEGFHDEIRDAVRLESPLLAAEEPESYAVVRKPRDPVFRRAVITAYERRCAMCGFDVRLDDRLLGLEAAHIRWHSCGGPDRVPNGLALCILHHRALDRGAIGLRPDAVSRRATYRLIVSDELSGGSDAFRQLVGINDQPLRPPQAPHFRPDPQFVRWHRKEVFRGEPRAA